MREYNETQLAKVGELHLRRRARADLNRCARTFALRQLRLAHLDEYARYRQEFLSSRPPAPAAYTVSNFSRGQLAEIGRSVVQRRRWRRQDAK